MVSSVGMPSKNSSMPIRVDTRSGVMIFEGIDVLYPGRVSAATDAIARARSIVLIDADRQALAETYISLDDLAAVAEPTR